MNAVGITITVAAVALSLTLSVYVFFFSNRTTKKSNTTQTATASGSARLSQAGRDVLDVGNLNSYTQVAPEGTLFLAEGEAIATSETVEEFRAQVDRQWSEAQHYVIGVSLYGRPFMPSEERLADILRRGVSLSMTLVDPESQAARTIATDKCRFSRTVRQNDVLAETLGINSLEVDVIHNRIREEVNGTVAMLRRIKQAHPEVNVNVQFIDFLPTWKGNSIDGLSAVYVIYDVPRLDVPFRFTSDVVLIKYYEERYAKVYARQGRAIAL